MQGQVAGQGNLYDAQQVSHMDTWNAQQAFNLSSDLVPSLMEGDIQCLALSGGHWTDPTPSIMADDNLVGLIIELTNMISTLGLSCS